MARLTPKSSERTPDFLPHVLRIGTIAADYKAIDLRAYDVRDLTLIADSFVICSAASEPQFKAIANGIRDRMKKAGVRLLRSEGEPRGGWRVLDYGIVIVHIFREEARAFYDLDGLWGDAPAIDLGSSEKPER